MTNTKILPIPVPVVAALVARFDPNLNALHYSGSEVMFHINNYNLTSYGAWRVSMTHISGEEILATLTADPTADFGWAIKHSVCHEGIWYPQD